MANFKNKWDDNDLRIANINQKKLIFFCDTDCISCAVCRENAPNNFKLSELGNHSICFQQPKNLKELEECEEAMICCPANAIGKIEY